MAVLPIADGAPSAQTHRSLANLIADFLDMTLYDPLVFPCSDSRPIISSKILSLSSFPLVKMLNWTTSHMSADSSKANDEKVHARTRSFCCSHTS